MTRPPYCLAGSGNMVDPLASVLLTEPCDLCRNARDYDETQDHKEI